MKDYWHPLLYNKDIRKKSDLCTKVICNKNAQLMIVGIDTILIKNLYVKLILLEGDSSAKLICKDCIIDRIGFYHGVIFKNTSILNVEFINTQILEPIAYYKNKSCIETFTPNSNTCVFSITSSRKEI